MKTLVGRESRDKIHFSPENRDRNFENLLSIRSLARI